jgi:hypothetical protein
MVMAMKQWLLYPALASAVTLILHFAVGLRFGISAFAAFVGWPLIGTLVTADDDLPGGWSNPDGTVKPPWRTGLFWSQLAAGFAVSAFVGALDVGVLTQTGVAFALAGIFSGSVAIVLLRHHCRSHASQRIEPSQ